MNCNTGKVSAWLEGEKAYMENKSDATCPYSCDNPDRKMWIQGYQNIKNLKETYRGPSYLNKLEKT